MTDSIGELTLDIKSRTVETSSNLEMIEKSKLAIAALTKSVYGAIEDSGYKINDGGIVADFLSFLRIKESDIDFLSSEDDLNRVIQIGVIILDTLVVDELSTYYSNLNKGKAYYGRSEPWRAISDMPEIIKAVNEFDTKGFILSASLLTKSESDHQIANLPEVFGASIPCKSIEDFFIKLEDGSINDDDTYVHITDYVSISEFLDKKDKLFDKAPESFSVDLYIDFGSVVINLAIWRQADGYGVGRPTEPPRQTLPRAELWKKYIKDGYSLYEDTNDIERPDTPREAIQSIDDLINKLRTDQNLGNSIIRKKWASYLSGANSLTEIEEYSRQNVAKEFSSIKGHDKVLLTRSGSSANLLAMHIASDYARSGLAVDQVNLYVDTDFYYENNIFSNEINFVVKKTYDDADVLCLSADINTPIESQNEFVKRRSDLLQLFFDKAKLNPSKRYSIVFDKTADPSSGLFDSIEVPENVKIVESISFSKFQRGNKNAFYGAVITDDLNSERINRFMADSWSEPTEYNIVTFPKVSRSDVQRLRHRNSETYKRLKKLVDESKTLAEQGWKITEANYYFFLVPPPKYWASSSRDAKQMVSNVTRRISEKNILNVGDSYGTEKPRMSAFIFPQQLPNTNEVMHVPGIRITYGIESDADQIFRAIEESVGSMQEIENS